MRGKHYHRVQVGSSGTQHVEVPCDCCDELRAENERLRADQRLLDESVRNQAIRETIHKEELRRLRAAVLAYDDAIRKASWRGQRVIDDDDNLDERYAQMLLAAGREPEAT